MGQRPSRVVVVFTTFSVAYNSHGYPNPQYLLIIKLSAGTRGRNIFTRFQQGAVFSEAYKESAVHASTLRNLGNFKDLIGGSSIHRAPGISKVWAMHLEKRGMNVLTSFKGYIHSLRWTTLSKAGGFEEKPSHFMLVGGAADLKHFPPFQPKAVDAETRRHIAYRYKSSHERFRSTYPDGELIAGDPPSPQ